MLTTLFASAFYRRVSTLTANFQRLFELTRDPYRPERHYMRGPGPEVPSEADARADRSLEFLRLISPTSGAAGNCGGAFSSLLSKPVRPKAKAPDTGQKSPDCFLLKGSGFNHSGGGTMRIAQSIAAASIAIFTGFALPVSAAPSTSSLNSHAGANAQAPVNEPSTAGCHAYQKNADGAWVEMTCHEGIEPASSPPHGKSAHHHSGNENSSQ